MRGLLFTGGTRPDMKLAEPLFGSYSFVVAADSGLLGAEEAGIVPDCIVGDMDSLPDRAVLDRYSAETIHEWPADKDFSDTELAMGILADKGIDEILLVGGSGGRMDHFFAVKALFDTDMPPAMWIGDESVAVASESGTGRSVIRIAGLEADAPVSVFPVGAGPHRCLGAGFQWAVDELDWDGGKYSLSNHCRSGSCRLEAVAGRFMIVVPLSPAVSILPADAGL